MTDNTAQRDRLTVLIDKAQKAAFEADEKLWVHMWAFYEGVFSTLLMFVDEGNAIPESVIAEYEEVISHFDSKAKD